MYEFAFGIFFGVIAGRYFSINKQQTRDAMVQADEPVIKTSAPILITKKFVPGSLSNFWGSDS